MILKFTVAALACAAALTVDARAQTAAPDAHGVEPVVTGATAQGTDARIPVKTVVQIEITEALSSKTSIIGDMFALKLAAPLILDGRTILPAGLVGRGEVTHAAKSGGGGKAGELIVNARYLECGGLRIPLGHFRYGIAGKDNIGAAFATAQVIPFGQFLISGHDAVIPLGTGGTAQVKADVEVPAGVIERCAPTAE